MIEGNYETNKNIKETIKEAKKRTKGKIVWFGRSTIPIQGVECINNPSIKDIPKLYNRSKTLLKKSKDDPRINRDGRPKGAGISITTAIKKELEKVPEGQKATYLDLLVKKILKKGIVDGDNSTVKNIWNYVDGKPRETIGLDGGLDEDNQPKPLLGGESNGISNNNSDLEKN